MPERCKWLLTTAKRFFFSGLMAARQGDTVQALSLYQQSLRLKPRYLETYNQLASLYRVLRNPQAALVYNGQALRYFPTNARLHYGRGLIYHSEGKLDSAMACYQQAMQRQSGYFQAYFQAGLIDQTYRRYYAALANYQRVQQLRPQFPRIDTYIGYCHEQMGQYDLAITAYTKAIGQNATDRQASAGLWRSKRHQRAYTEYNPLFLPNGSGEPLPTVRSRTQLDTSRVRIAPIQPKARISTGSNDSLQRTVKPIGQN